MNVFRLCAAVAIFVVGSAYHTTNSAEAAEYSDWMRISGINRFLGKLEKTKQVPMEIQCRKKRVNSPLSSAEFRIKTVDVSKVSIARWRVSADQINPASYANHCTAKGSKYRSISCIRPGASGLGLRCAIRHR